MLLSFIIILYYSAIIPYRDPVCSATGTIRFLYLCRSKMANIIPVVDKQPRVKGITMLLKRITLELVCWTSLCPSTVEIMLQCLSMNSTLHTIIVHTR